MHFLDKIIDHINASLLSSLSGKTYQKAEFRGIAETIYRATDKENEFEQLPCIIDSKGETIITPDDRMTMLVYYRVPSEIYRLNNGNGDGKKEIVDSVDVSMLVYAFRKEVGMNSRALNAALIDALPFDRKIKIIVNPGMSLSANIIPLGTNYQTKQLLEREFGTENVAEFLQPENYFFEIKIKIESIHEKGCFSNCNCN